MKHQIFISYRRDGGAAMARLMYEKLSELGYSVFYDMESLKGGLFNKSISEKIEECNDFLLILPKNALSNLQNDEDWLCEEIRQAIKTSKNIIPVFMKGFAFPQELPEDIETIRSVQAIDFTEMTFFDARLDALVQGLVSRPTVS